MPTREKYDFEPAELLEQAAYFEREGNLQGALERAQLALKYARGDVLDDAVIALDRIVAAEHAWRAGIEEREARHEELERSSLELTDEQRRDLENATAPSALARALHWLRGRLAPSRAAQMRERTAR